MADAMVTWDKEEKLYIRIEDVIPVLNPTLETKYTGKPSATLRVALTYINLVFLGRKSSFVVNDEFNILFICDLLKFIINNTSI